jgi:hypothetical protein
MKVPLALASASLAAVGIYFASYSHAKAAFEEADAKFSIAKHGRDLGDSNMDAVCSDRYQYLNPPDNQGIPGVGGPNKMSYEEYGAVVVAGAAGGITIACLSGLWGLFLLFCRCCKCKGCGGVTPTKGCCCKDEPIHYSSKEVTGNKIGTLLLFVVILVTTACAGAGDSLFSEGLLGMFAAVLKEAKGLETSVHSMDARLQTINMTSMAEMSTEMSNAVDRIEEIQVMGALLNQLRSAAIGLVMVIPLLAGVLGLCGILSKKKVGAFCSTLFGFLGLIFIWLTYAVHAPFGRVGDDLCYTIDDFLCGGEVNEAACFLSGVVAGVQASLDEELDLTLAEMANITAANGYSMPSTQNLNYNEVNAILDPWVANIDKDVTALLSYEVPDFLSCMGEGNEKKCLKQAESLCITQLNALLQPPADGPAAKICGDLKESYGISTVLVAVQLGLLNDLVKVVSVLYEVLAQLMPYAECDYVIDLMASVKTLLCNMLIRGVVMIQYACALEGVILLFFVLLTTQGCKRWVSGAASVEPVQVMVKSPA